MSADTALHWARILFIAAAVLAAAGGICLAVARFDRRAGEVIAEHVSQALDVPGDGPSHLADMPKHPDKPGPFDDYTEQRYQRLVGPLAAEQARWAEDRRIERDARRDVHRRHT